MKEFSTASEDDAEAAWPADDGPDFLRDDSIAIHEAAHAVAMVALGLELRSVDIRQRRTSTGDLARGTTEMSVTDVNAFIGCGERPDFPT